jgi:hypothetical protein
LVNVGKWLVNGCFMVGEWLANGAFPANGLP